MHSTAQRTRDGQHGVGGGGAQQGVQVQAVALCIQGLAHCGRRGWVEVDMGGMRSKSA